MFSHTYGCVCMCVVLIQQIRWKTALSTFNISNVSKVKSKKSVCGSRELSCFNAAATHTHTHTIDTVYIHRLTHTDTFRQTQMYSQMHTPFLSVPVCVCTYCVGQQICSDAALEESLMD